MRTEKDIEPGHIEVIFDHKTGGYQILAGDGIPLETVLGFNKRLQACLRATERAITGKRSQVKWKVKSCRYDSGGQSSSL